MTDSTFTNINSLFVKSFNTDENDPTKNFFGKCYVLLVEIKEALINKKPFFDQPIKNKQGVYEKPEMSRENYYTTATLLD